ncbi:FecR family protein [Dinghuibacter silviterrae]|nr:FecR domain-containing protein [Dinghuibacter silviterrae]
MQDLPSLIRKFWEGTASPEEQHRLLQWLSSEGANETFRVLYEQDLRQKTPAMSEQRSEEILKTLLQQTAPPKVRSLSWIGWAAAAAVVAGVIATTLLKKEHEVVKPVVAKAIPRQTDTLRNDGTIAQTLTLRDRSTVQLEPQSLIILGQAFDSTDRRIYLKGKARFKVTKDAGRPFSVQAGNVTTRVLGTEFIVNAQTPQRVTVQLLSGRVLVEGASTVYLKPGESVTATGREMLKTLKKTQEAEPLTFDKTPLNIVFQRIAHKHHIQITYDPNDIRELRFTGSFQETDQLTMMLSVICNMNGLTYRQEEGRIVIQTTR